MHLAILHGYSSDIVDIIIVVDDVVVSVMELEHVVEEQQTKVQKTGGESPAVVLLKTEQKYP